MYTHETHITKELIVSRNINTHTHTHTHTHTSFGSKVHGISTYCPGVDIEISLVAIVEARVIADIRKSVYR
jgi:hypothetical protein